MTPEVPNEQRREIRFQEYVGANDPDKLREMLTDNSLSSIRADAAQPWGACVGVIAAEWGHREVLALLSEFGFSVEPDAGRGVSRLRSSRTSLPEDDILSLVDVLIERGANLSPPGWTPLHLAARGGYERVVERLLEVGVDPLADAHGSNFQPLHAALFHSDGEVFSPSSRRIVELLIERGADVDDCWGFYPQTPLAHAALNYRVGIARFLLERGANPNAPDEGDDTPLHKATTHLHRLPAVSGVPASQVIEMVTLLLDAGANPNAVNRYGVTPLLAAIPYPAYREVCRVLIARGADVNVVDASGYTPLARVVGEGDEEFVRELLTFGAHPLAGSKDHSAIESAVYWGNELILSTLLAAIPAMALNPLNDVLLHSSVHKDAAGCVALLE
ncbi:MAG: ankyrin repeat domain-containing protein, partial [Fibrella sp.]|nr:ankyrin repeat domain-containing protein [Armatimonadota bacterium]